MEYLKQFFTLKNIRLISSWLLTAVMIMIVLDKTSMSQLEAGRIISLSLSGTDFLILFAGYIISHGEFSVRYTKEEKETK